MFYPRPVSPVSLETCVPSPSEIDTDDLLASDDELDDTAHAAKRQRVENLARSYLQGKPLLILSASLTGPFNDGWVNPWKKDRTRGTGASSRSSGGGASVPERVVQETDLRARRYRESLLVNNACPEVPASSFESLETSVHGGDRSGPSKSPRGPFRTSTPQLTHNRQNESSRQSSAKAYQTRPAEVDEQSIKPPGAADWLRKDRKLMNFTKFEPPSSPTTSVASRHSDKARRAAPRLVHVQVPQTPGSPIKSHPAKTVAAKTARKSNLGSNGHTSDRPRAATSTSPKASSVPITSPQKRSHLPQEVSFRIVNSSSQLPRFEYRRCISEHPGQQEQTSSLQDESILQEETMFEPGSPLQEAPRANPAPAGYGPVKPPALHPIEQGPSFPEGVAVPDVPSVKKDARHDTASKENRSAEEVVTEAAGAEKELVEEEAAEGVVDENANKNAPDEAETSTYQNTEYSGPTERATIEQNTCEEFPSAQQVPAPLGVSDRIISLQSTAAPKGHSERDSHTSPDTQLSTQAALLHAQKSFQNDLASPEYHTHQTPDQERALRLPDGSTHSTNVTPFYRIEETLQPGLDRSTKTANEGKIQAMSTQYMLDAATPFNFSAKEAGQSSKLITRHMTQAMSTQAMLDAATPYTFSTEKKPRPSRPGSGSSSKKRRKLNFASPGPSIRSQSISGDNDDQTAISQSSEDEESPRPAAQHPAYLPTHQSATDAAASVPLALGESLPTTEEDGQGVPQGMESFNLHPAIADAGSWLQQSFDLNYSGASETRRPIITGDAQARLMNLSQ
ncbi:hypothetical protein N7535_009078 [Penicillium sp. DV-2018c]|nr:hypothetical protein N7535_009078 [Penicillium sp. DV-2018c]